MAQATEQQAAAMADTIRVLCRALGAPIPRHWSTAEVLQFAIQLIKESDRAL
jgi:hypothetical protein